MAFGLTDPRVQRFTRSFSAVSVLKRVLPILSILLTAYLVLKGFEHYNSVIKKFPWDEHIDYGAAKVVAAGRNPYTVEGLRELNLSLEMGLGHPPTSLVWFLPLVHVDVQGMKVIWNELTLFWLILHIWLVSRELRLPSVATTVPLVFGAVLCTSWMTDHLDVVQLSELIAFLYVLAWYNLRRGRDFTAGLMLGLGCTLKFYPGVVVLYMLLCKRWRAVGGAIVAWGAFALYVTPKVGIFGWQAFFEQTKPYTKFWLAHVRNSSIQAIIQRFKWTLCDHPPSAHDAWEPGLKLASVVSLTLILSVWWLCRREVTERRSIDMPFALFTLVSLITGPYMWEHYNVTLIFPFFVVVVAAITAWQKGMSWKYLAAVFVALACICGVLAIPMELKTQVWTDYRTHPEWHFRLHFLEIANFISTPALILILVLLFRSRRRGGDLALRFPVWETAR